MTKATRWTDEKIKALKLPPEKNEQRVLVEPGLYLFIRKRASDELAKQWQFRAQVNGKRRWLSLGAYPAVGLAKARDELRAHQTTHEAAKKGEADHPALEARLARKKAKAEPSVAEAFAEMLEDKRLGSSRKGGEPVRERTIALLQESFNKDILPRAGDVKLSKVNQDLIQSCIDAPRKRKAPGAAAHVYKVWRALINFGAQRRYITTIDPMLGIKNPRPYSPKPVTAATDHELKALFQILAESEMSAATRLAFELQLATGVRPDEAVRAAVSEFDTAKRIWTLPKERSKNNAAFKIHLSDETLRIIEAAKALAQENNPYLFPGRTIGEPQGKTVLSRALLRAGDRLEELGCRRLKPHDLRKTFRTLLSRLGVAPHIAERCINHKEKEIMRRVYDGHDYFPEMVAAWDLASSHIQALRTGGAEVIPIFSAKA